MNKFCLPKKNKLVTKTDFKLSAAKKVSNSCFLANYATSHKQARIGIIVSKRIAKLAVTRNQIKRVVRESFRLNQQKLTGYDIIVVAKQPCDTLTKVELRKGIEDLWLKLIMRSKLSSSG